MQLINRREDKNMAYDTKREETRIRSTYTWKNEYLLPFESFWGRIAKFCYLNCVPWTYINSSLKKYFYAKLSSDEMFCIYLPSFNGKRYEISDDIFNDINRNYEVYRYCPECMKYGYHSILHEIDGFDYCFLHQCKLVLITKKELVDSKNGIYSFFDVQVKNIIYYKPIYDDIMKYIERRNVEGIISASHFFVDSKQDSKSYESTERLYQRLFLLQDSVELYGCQCISAVQIDDIYETNRYIFEDIMHNYTQNIMERNDYWSSIEEKDFMKIYTYCKKMFLQPNPQNQYLLTEDTLAWCFIAIISNEIQRIFGNLDDWYDTIQCFKKEKDYFNKNIETTNKFLIILACATITGSFDPNIVFQYDSRKWDNFFTPLDFKIPVKEILGYWGKVYDSKIIGPSRATQYIIYPIINDLFQTIMSQIKILLQQGVINTKYDSILKLNNVWNVPQYAVFYYKDRVEVYRCEPEY